MIRYIVGYIGRDGLIWARNISADTWQRALVAAYDGTVECRHVLYVYNRDTDIYEFEI